MSSLATAIKNLQCENYSTTTLEVQDFLNQFYTQIIQQPVIFTTAGFYDLNLSLLASIFTGVASYQIILVQFYVSSLS